MDGKVKSLHGNLNSPVTEQYRHTIHNSLTYIEDDDDDDYQEEVNFWTKCDIALRILATRNMKNRATTINNDIPHIFLLLLAPSQ